MSKVWEQVLEILNDNLNAHVFEAWIKPVKFVAMDESLFTISTNSNLSKEWIYKNYNDLIVRAVSEVTGKSLKLNIIISKADETAEIRTKPQSGVPLSENQMNVLRTTSTNLNVKYTFDNFVVGSHNKFCHAIAHAVAKNPAKAHNPLFIYGGVGLGKTHLMQAIGHYILANSSNIKIKYTSSETFTNELINSLKNNTAHDFKKKYREVDVLLIDDIQFIEGKIHTQEEFFHTFNDLYESGKQIVLTSDKPPKDISTLTERLRSRFEWGILADIGVPDIETRIAILKNKIERDGITLNIPNDVLEIIATAYQNNIRELEGALNRVVAYASINNCAITCDSIRNIINFAGSGAKLSVDKIIETTASFFSMEPSDIRGQARNKEYSYARQIAVYLTRDMTNSSFPAIGEAFGNRKHTSILYAYEKVKEEILTNRVLSEHINEISKRITSNIVR